MRRLAPGLLLCALLFWGAEPRAFSAPPPPADEWTGSEACAACHKEIYERWRATTHALSVRPWAPEVAAKEFDGEVFTARGISQRIGPGPSMEVEGPGGGMARFPVESVVGLRRVQMFLTTLPRGHVQVLPVFLEVPSRKWFDYADFIFGMPRGFVIEPDSPNSWYHYARNFNSRCGECHMSGYEVGYEADAAEYRTRWKEPNVGCEACHGAGGEHAAMWRRLERGTDPIVNPSRLSIEQANEVCAYCHSEREEIATGYRPGDDLWSFVDINGLEDVKHAYPDGRAKELLHNFVPILESRCGPMTCTKCHDPHGRGRPGDLHRPLDDDRMCTQCHGRIGADPVAHSHHKVDDTGGRCVNCHMPPLRIEGGHGWIRDHTISIPSLVNTRFGSMNACRGCHLDKEPNWERESFSQWYPLAEERNHRVALAATISAGRAGDPKAAEPLRKMLEDANAVYRAGAAWMLSQYDVDLRPQLEDSHPMVRRAALKGVAKLHPEALEPLVDDPNEVIRHAAAALLAEKYEYVRPRPDLREKLIAVLTRYAEMRPDYARNHFAIGALHQLAGRKEEAERHYARYRRLNPFAK